MFQLAPVNIVGGQFCLTMGVKFPLTVAILPPKVTEIRVDYLAYEC